MITKEQLREQEANVNRCYECYKEFLDLTFSIKDSCPIYQSLRKGNDPNCPYFASIFERARRFQIGERGKDIEEHQVVRMLIDRADIK